MYTLQRLALKLPSSPTLCINNLCFKPGLRDKIAKGFIDYVLFGELMQAQVDIDSG